MQDGGPDPGADKDGDNTDERDAATGFDVDFLVVEQCGNDERAEDAGEVGEETGEGTRSNGEVFGQPGTDETVVEVADEECWEQE